MGFGNRMTPAPATRPASRASVVDTDSSVSSSRFGPRRRRQLVGAPLDVGVEGATGVGGHAVAVDQARAPRARDCVRPFVVAPAACRLGDAPRRPAHRGRQHVGRAPVDAGGHQRGVVPVAAVLAQQREAVPQREQRRSGHGRATLAGTGPAPRRAGRRAAAQHLGGGGDVVAVGVRPEHVPQGGIGPGQPRRQGLRRGRHRPHLREGLGDHLRMEVVEAGGDRSRPDRPERRRPGGEVAPPEATDAGVGPRRRRGGVEVDDGVHGFADPPEPACEGGVHRTSLPAATREGCTPRS